MTSKYFNEYTDIEEQRLYSDLIEETVYNYGVEALYLPRDSGSSVDLLFGEDPTSIFTTSLPVDLFVQSVDNFEGGELFSKFGLEVRKQARFLLTNRSFQKAIAEQSKTNYLDNRTQYSNAENTTATTDILIRPREGDLIWMPNFRALFEIVFADEEYFFYAFGKNNIYGYSLVCEKFRYSNEVVATGIDDLDSAINNIVAAYDYLMANSNGSFSYTPGEAVSQGNTTATIVSWDLPSLTLTLKDIQGVFSVNNTIVGANSGAVFTLVSNDPLQQVNPNIDNNVDLQNEGIDIINFSEENPFGEPTP